MTIPLEVLAAEVLGLAPEEHKEPFDSAWEQAWAAEIDRREVDFEAGRAEWIPGAEAVARIRSQLKLIKGRRRNALWLCATGSATHIK